ncbi:MAG: sporulation protein YqfD [Clostridia bacterium]|nr:sporulation protein YqfD [Clostridia bacterium]
MPVFSVKERLYIEGLMPERALLRLRRAGIPLFDVKKTDKTTLLVSVEKKDVEKVFAIYPNVCYNTGERSSFTARLAPKKGLAARLSTLKKRVGLLLGGLLFIGLTAFADGFVCGVEFVGTDAYARETYAALYEANIKMFAPYRSGKEDLICAKLLAIDGVEFCSVQKKGMRLVVEIRTAPFAKDSFQNGKLYAGHTGEIVSMTVLRGTPLKNTGDFVNAGEPLVGDWFVTEDGGQVRVQAIARVRMACTYEEEIAAASEEEAFAAAYLAVGVTENVTLTNREIAATETGFKVKLSYQALQTINF